jgi:membrane fusion protein (multidrug efflux system)
MKRRMITMLLIVGVVLVLVFGGYLFKQHFMDGMLSHYEMPPVTVASATAKSEHWQPYLTAVGSLVAINGVDVTPQASGIISQINFKSGATVKKGDVLIQIDDQVEQANLKDYNAQLKLAELTYKRALELYKKEAGSKSDVDTDYANLEAAQANALVTKTQIAYKRVEAPFDGKLGIRQVDVGQYISPGNPIVTLQSLDPLYVHFALPEQSIKQVHVGQKIAVSTGANSKQLVYGKINAISSQVDASSRSFKVQAQIPNSDHVLLPGMFAHVNVYLPAQDQVVTIPQTAVNYNLYGNIVYVLEKQANKTAAGKVVYHAKIVYVTTGERQGDKVTVKKGLKAGDVVASAGQIKLNNSDRVTINNTVEP